MKNLILHVSKQIFSIFKIEYFKKKLEKENSLIGLVNLYNSTNDPEERNGVYEKAVRIALKKLNLKKIVNFSRNTVEVCLRSSLNLSSKKNKVGLDVIDVFAGIWGEMLSNY